MTKRVRVQLFGLHNRGIDVDAEATEGAVLGEDLRWPDGSLVTPQTIINQTTIVETPTGPTAIASTIWSLILEIPAFIQALAALVTGTTGIVVKGAGDTALTRSIVAEDDRITVANGDGLAGDPTVGLTDWPPHKNFIGAAEALVVASNFQYLIIESFDVQGILDIEADGTLAIL